MWKKVLVLHLVVEVLKTWYKDQNSQDCDKHASKVHDEGGLVHGLCYITPLLFPDEVLRTDGYFRVCGGTALRRRCGTRLLILAVYGSTIRASVLKSSSVGEGTR